MLTNLHGTGYGAKDVDRRKRTYVIMNENNKQLKISTYKMERKFIKVPNYILEECYLKFKLVLYKRYPHKWKEHDVETEK